MRRVVLLCGLVVVVAAVAYLVLKDGGRDQIASPAPLRKITEGIVVGFETDAGALSWRGIRYAAPLAPQDRWTLPKPPRPMLEPFDAYRPAALCAQLGNAFEDPPEGGFAGVEDCLTLDITTPKGDIAGLPVMVWIHGGGNSWGGPTATPNDRLVKDGDVVLVQLRYRLGPFGFFSHAALRDLDVATANFGLEDQIAALKWIAANIDSFGGDPENITVFGESAGGRNIFNLILSPRAKGLFHQAIIESGSSVTVTRAHAEDLGDVTATAHRNSSGEIVLRLLQAHGKAADREAAIEAAAVMASEDLISLMQSVSTGDLLAIYKATPESRSISLPNAIRDGFTIPDAEPADLIAASQYNAVPTILGTNRDEQKLYLINNDDFTERNLAGIPSMKDPARYARVAHYLSRAWKWSGADGPATWFAAQGSAPVYVYRFDWDEQPSLFGADLGALMGASHAMEIPFVFGEFEDGLFPDYMFGSADEPGRLALSATIRGYWTNFARNGEPDGIALTSWDEWENGAAEPFLILDTEAGGGTRMGGPAIDPRALEAALLNDDVIADMAARCAVVDAMIGFRGWAQADYERFADGACVADEAVR